MFGRFGRIAYICNDERKKYMEKEKVIDNIRRVAKTALPPGSTMLLYGSQARGDAHDGSDWDLLILLDKDRLDQSDYDHVSYPFVLLGCDMGEEVNPIMYTRKEWESYHITPFYENVIHDSIHIA